MTRGRQWVFSVRWWALFAFWSLLYFFLSVPAFLLTNPLVDPTRRRFAAMNRLWGTVTMRMAFGRHFRVHGLENLPPQDGPWVLVSLERPATDLAVAPDQQVARAAGLGERQGSVGVAGLAVLDAQR